MSEFVFGVILILLMLFPWFSLGKPIKTLSTISTTIAIIFLLIPIFLPHILLSLGEEIIAKGDYMTIMTFIPMVNIALFPVTAKGTFLLWKHEIRLFNFMRYISTFLISGLLNIVHSVAPILYRLLEGQVRYLFQI